jgi:hypothetical protein
MRDNSGRRVERTEGGPKGKRSESSSAVMISGLADPAFAGMTIQMFLK